MKTTRHNLIKMIWIFSISLLIILPVLNLALSLFFYRNEFNRRSDQLTEDFFKRERLNVKHEVEILDSMIKFQRRDSYDHHKELLKVNTETAFHLVEELYNKNSQILSKPQIEIKISETLQTFSYKDEHSNFFILKSDGTQLFQTFPSVTPENSDNPPDKMNIRKAVDFVQKEGEGFYTFEAGNSEIGELKNQRLIYLKQFKPFNWIIGSEILTDHIEKEIQSDILNYIEEFYEENHFFVGTWNGITLSGPGIGKNLWDIEDMNGKKVVQELIKKAKLNGGFVEYKMPSGVSSRSFEKKTSYVLGIKEWQWYFGTGIYTEDLSKELILLQASFQKESRENLLISLSATVLLGLLIILASIYFIKTLSKDFNTFYNLFKKATLDGHSIDTEKLKFREFYELAYFANMLINQKERSQKDRQRLRSLETMGFLAGGIAHEFNNILAGIFGNIELANSKIPHDSTSKVFLETALDSMDKARELTGRLLTFSEGGNPRIEKIDCFMIEANLVEKISAEGLTGKLDFEDNLPMVLADAKQLNLIWESLLSNIREAIVISDATAEEKTVSVKAEEVILNDFSESHLTGNFIRFSVIDYGPGITPENLTKIFDPYFTTKQIGNGLGLSTIFAIVKRHRGHIDVKSTRGKGTTVIIHLPSCIK